MPGCQTQLSAGRDSPSPAGAHQSSRQPLIRRRELGGGWRAPAPPPPREKPCRERKKKKKNARNYSGWQINKLSLITIRVSQPPLPRAHQLCVLSLSAPAGFIPATAPCSSPGCRWEPHGTPSAAGRTPRRREVPFQQPKFWEDAMAELCLDSLALGSEHSGPSCQAQTKIRGFFPEKKPHRGIILVRKKNIFKSTFICNSPSAVKGY